MPLPNPRKSPRPYLVKRGELNSFSVGERLLNALAGGVVVFALLYFLHAVVRAWMSGAIQRVIQ